MSGDQVTITQIGTPLDYVRLWDNSASAFVDLDAESKSVAGTAKALIEQTSDVLYIGDASTFAYIGFLPEQAGDYTGFKLEYAASGSYAITGVNQGNKTFTVAESVASKFVSGSHFSITGSTGNDGTYTCDGNATGTGPTTITVNEAIANATVDGTISTIWTNITSVVKDTDYTPFEERGYVAFPIQSDWTARTVNTQSAYWVRVLVSGITTIATMTHMMRSLVIDKALVLAPDLGSPEMRYTRDINGGIGKRDRGYKGVRSLYVDMTPVSITATELQLLIDWEESQPELYIEESRQSSPIDFTADSFYKTFTGRLVKVPAGMKSMEKMDGSDYRLHFWIDTTTSLSTTLGLSL